MKKFIILPAYFLLTFVVLLTILTFLCSLSEVITHYPNYQAIPQGIHISLIPSGIQNMLPAAVILGVILSFFRLINHPVHNFVPILLLMITAYGTLTGGLLLGHNLFPKSFEVKKELSHYLIKRELNNFQGVSFLPDAVKDNTVFDILLYNEKNEEKKFSFYDAVAINIEEKKFNLKLPETEIKLEIKNPFEDFLYSYDEFTTTILKAFSLLRDELLREAKKSGLYFFLFSLAIILILVSSSMFLRITDWPLFNILLFGSMITGILFLFYIYKIYLFEDLSKLVESPDFMTFIPVLFMLFISVIFILVDLIFVKNKFWEKEKLK